jgi:hypothetical protein
MRHRLSIWLTLGTGVLILLLSALFAGLVHWR